MKKFDLSQAKDDLAKLSKSPLHAKPEAKLPKLPTMKEWWTPKAIYTNSKVFYYIAFDEEV